MHGDAEAGAGFTQLFQAVGIAAGAFDQVIFFSPLVDALVLIGVIAAIDAFHNTTHAFADDEFRCGSFFAERVGCNGHATRLFDTGQQLLCAEVGCKGRLGAENQKITLIAMVFLADEQTHAIGLQAWRDMIQRIHAMVIGDADAVQTETGRVSDNIIQG